MTFGSQHCFTLLAHTPLSRKISVEFAEHPADSLLLQAEPVKISKQISDACKCRQVSKVAFRRSMQSRRKSKLQLGVNSFPNWSLSQNCSMTPAKQTAELTETVHLPSVKVTVPALPGTLVTTDPADSHKVCYILHTMESIAKHKRKVSHRVCYILLCRPQRHAHAVRV